MPIYEYRCADCGHELEKMQKLAEAPLTDCPECGRPSLKKVISPVGFRLKGSGWYETDFKKGDKKKNLHEAGEKAGATDKTDKKESGDKAGADKKSDAGGGSETKSKPDPKPAAA